MHAVNMLMLQIAAKFFPDEDKGPNVAVKAIKAATKSHG